MIVSTFSCGLAVCSKGSTIPIRSFRQKLKPKLGNRIYFLDSVSTARNRTTVTARLQGLTEYFSKCLERSGANLSHAGEHKLATLIGEAITNAEEHGSGQMVCKSAL